MTISKKEIEGLKKSYDLKVNIFNLIRNGKNEEATSLLKKDNDALSYFMKFKLEGGHGQVISSTLEGWKIYYYPSSENTILTDLDKIKKGIEEKEARYEQQKYLNQQKEFLELQKRDIIENKEDRGKTQRLTFVLAFGIIITSIFYLFQALIEFKKSGKLHTLIISGIFIFVFYLLILFTFFVFNLNKELKDFFKASKKQIIFLILAIVILGVLLLIVPDKDLNNDSNNEISDGRLSQNNVYPKTNDSTPDENLGNSKENITELNLSKV